MPTEDASYESSPAGGSVSRDNGRANCMRQTDAEGKKGHWKRNVAREVHVDAPTPTPTQNEATCKVQTKPHTTNFLTKPKTQPASQMLLWKEAY